MRRISRFITFLLIAIMILQANHVNAAEIGETETNELTITKEVETDILTEIEKAEAAAPAKAAGLRVTSQPSDISVAAGNTASFTVTAVGSGLSYQWQYSKNSGKSWVNCSSTGNNTSVFSFIMKESYAHRQYRCKVSDSNGNYVFSEAAVLSLAESSLKIIRQPVSQTISAGAAVSLSVEAEGSNLRFQWQYSKNNGGSWVNCSSTGSSTENFSFTMKESYAGRKYRCVVNDSAGNQAISDAATIQLSKTEIIIKTQPVSQTTVVGSKVVLSIEASGEGLVYQWQYNKNNGTSWTNCSGPGYNTPIFEFKASKAINGRIYRCKLTDYTGKTALSDSVPITVTNLTIISQPEDCQSKENDTVVLSVQVNDGAQPYTYQWQYSKNNGTSWNNCTSTGSNTSSFSFKMKTALNGRLYQCIIRDANGNKVTTNTALVSLLQAEEDVLTIAGRPWKLGSKISTMGTPDEILPSSFGFNWYIYGTQTYTNFVAAGVLSDGTIACLASAGTSFEYQGMKCGGTLGDYTADSTYVDIYTDKNDNYIVHAVKLVSGNSSYGRYARISTLKALAGEAKLNFHLVNAFRVYHGLGILIWDDTTAEVARLHSVDMADNNYFSHTGLDGSAAGTRLSDGSINWHGCGENINAGTFSAYGSGLESYKGWVNSTGHRANILRANWRYLGVGCAYNASSDYGYYATQNFWY